MSVYLNSEAGIKNLYLRGSVYVKEEEKTKSEDQFSSGDVGRSCSCCVNHRIVE
jgi:hypothetical protein